MQTATAITAEARDARGKGGARALRRAGKIPAIVYGAGQEPMTVSLPEKELRLAYQKGGFFSKIVSIDVAGQTLTALPKAIEFHPVTDKIEHVDLLQVNADSKIRVAVPVKILNAERSIGLKRGGVLNVVRHEIELICAPDAIPASIEIDILERNIGDSVHISSVSLPAGVEPAIKGRDFTIATIAGRNAKDEEEDKPAEAGAAAAASAKAPAAKAPAAKK